MPLHSQTPSFDWCRTVKGYRINKDGIVHVTNCVHDEPSSPYAATAQYITNESIQPPRVESPRIVEHFYIGDDDADDESFHLTQSIMPMVPKEIAPNWPNTGIISPTLVPTMALPSPNAPVQEVAQQPTVPDEITSSHLDRRSMDTYDMRSIKPNHNYPSVESMDGWKTGGWTTD